jgi:pyridoxamine 5'-phosphate oxidase
MTVDPHPWAHNLDTLLAHAWQRLKRGVNDRHAPARHPTLATVAPDGQPQARTVVLRGADAQAGVLEVHTDLRSAKIADLQTTPRAALHVWEAQAHLQLRISVTVDILTGDAVQAAWLRVPDTSRVAYGTNPAPGQPIADALAYTKTPDPAAFAVLRMTVQAMDVLHLGPQHRRALFTRAANWAGVWHAS